MLPQPPTTNPRYSATQISSAEQCFSHSMGRSLCTTHSVFHLAKDSTQDRSSFTPFSQHSWLDEKDPEHAKAAQAHQSEGTQEIKPSPYHSDVTRAFSTTSHQSQANSTVCLPSNLQISPPRNCFQDCTSGGFHTEASHASQFTERTRPSHANCSPSCVGKTPTEETQRQHRERSHVKPGAMSHLSSMFRYPILQPTEIHAINRAARALEKNFSFNSIKSKMLLDQRESSHWESRDVLKAYSLVEQGRTLFVVAFGSIQYDGLARLDELKNALQDLDTSIVESDAKLTNERRCSEIWTQVEAVEDQAISVGDALLDFGKHLSILHTWVCECLIPACIRFYSVVQLVNRDQVIKPKDKAHDAAASGSALLILEEVVKNLSTAQLMVTFYHSCITSFRSTIAQFLHAIPEGELSIEELVIWGRLCNLSVGDISNGLTPFLDISQKIASDMASDRSKSG
ncbi:hypothetical protein Pst134EA_002624 [Puccinia striiformis f. sp. tritici]|uniref:hypothetical protein n=1 Tax=Puccinia striiformis f. sp. tritici TaxID=168172 RepID=UPI002007A61F|nr:hypothetical protein Pst134EA_002624 [Puccinia striiformis f. sp. tritici]KAH9471996.1 hypothetical protein Pst134EA_002624 [Puccinia striiformis f. sp. tritici]KAI9617751.1 hypothetical protein KEM48_006994 [Puccinia striiformis f. sp. tritici PST-130]